MGENNNEEFLTMGEAARRLGLTKARISQLSASGSLAASLVGGRKMVSAASVLAYDSSRRGPGRRGRLETSSIYTLMSAEYEVARVAYDPQFEYPFEVLEVLDAERAPVGIGFGAGRERKRSFNSWWEHRSVPDTRPGLSAKLAQLGLSASYELPVASYGLSLSDCYWLRPEEHADLTWGELNYFDNEFVGMGDGRLTCASDSWLQNVGLASPDNTSEGELPKSWVIRGGRRILIKGCGLDDQRPFNEVVATVLFSRLLASGEFVPYELEEVGGGPACSCAEFLNGREEFIQATYARAWGNSVRARTVYDRFAKAAGLACDDEELVRTWLSKMIVCDSLLANSDRHWRNFGFIRNVDTLEVRPAPLFDTGNCLWHSKSAQEVGEGDYAFTARPFEVDPLRQLGLVDRISWFDERALIGFVDDAVELLAGSEHASADGRLSYIAEGIELRAREVTGALRVLSARL